MERPVFLTKKQREEIKNKQEEEERKAESERLKAIQASRAVLVS